MGESLFQDDVVRNKEEDHPGFYIEDPEYNYKELTHVSHWMPFPEEPKITAKEKMNNNAGYLYSDEVKKSKSCIDLDSWMLGPRPCDIIYDY